MGANPHTMLGSTDLARFEGPEERSSKGPEGWNSLGGYVPSPLTSGSVAAL